MKLKKFRGSFRFDSCRQRGVATLVVSVGVALLMAVAAVGMMRSGMLEQKIAANDLRMREAQEIAEARMQYVIAFGSAPGNQCPLDLNLSNNNNYIFNEIDLSSVVGVQTTSESYGVSVRWCHKTLSNTKIYFVRSQAEIPSAEAGKDPVVKAFVESWFRKKKDSFLNEIHILPPFFVKGDFCPDVVGEKGNNKPSSSCGGNASIGDREAYNENYGEWVVASGMVDVSSLHKNNSQDNKTDTVPTDVSKGEWPINSAWDYAFNITLDKAKDLALKNPGEPFYYFGDSNVNSKFGNESLGSKTNPIVLIIEGDSKGKCPKVQLDVYGVVYIKGPCDDNGWGGAKIYGSVISDGSITKLNAGATFYKFDDTLWSGLVGSAGFIVPGTWRDFEPEPQP